MLARDFAPSLPDYKPFLPKFLRLSTFLILFTSPFSYKSKRNNNNDEGGLRGPTQSSDPLDITQSGDQIWDKCKSESSLPTCSPAFATSFGFPSRACTQFFVVFLTNLYISYCLCPIISLLLTDHIDTVMIVDAQASNKKVRSRSRAKTTRTSTASPRTTGTAAPSPSSRRQRRQG